MTIEIVAASSENCPSISAMIGELLNEIIACTDVAAFTFNAEEATRNLEHFISNNRYSVFLALDSKANAHAGCITLCESRSIYAGGVFGTVQELYVRPAYRRDGIGRMLLDAAKSHGEQHGWKRLEVTTPPLPQFERTLAFYEREGFAITGGRKMKTAL